MCAVGLGREGCTAHLIDGNGGCEVHLEVIDAVDSAERRILAEQALLLAGIDRPAHATIDPIRERDRNETLDDGSNLASRRGSSGIRTLAQNSH